MEVNYAQWARAYKKTIKDMSGEEARKRHDERKPYFVVLGKMKSPSAFLEINNDFVYVGFLDSLQREYLKYRFTEVGPNKLFLEEIQEWKYEEDSDTKVFSTRYAFTPDGRYGIRKVELRTRNTETVEPQSTIDVSDLYTSYPTFGEYEHLLKRDRIDLAKLPG